MLGEPGVAAGRDALTRFDGEPLEVPDQPELRPDRELVAHRWERAVSA